MEKVMKSIESLMGEQRFAVENIQKNVSSLAISANQSGEQSDKLDVNSISLRHASEELGRTMSKFILR
jgi:methyl-accepting chemotaxis protein